ncbi:MAG TPA: YihY/virulence factor BrkB family protein [Usitatibacter sp.]|jgi:membrane protein|nr:YihY/virulence factor BrkB family protein [Usitatibacter sp.]
MKAAGLRSFGDLFVRAFKAWSADWAPSMGAALAFYTLFSLAPLLVLAIAIAGFVIGHDAAQELLMRELSGLLGETGARGVKSVLDATATQKDGLIATAVSLATLVLGATTVFAELRNDLDRIWHCQPPKSGGIWATLRARFLSFGMVVAIGFLLLVSLVLSAAVSYVGGLFGGSEVVMHMLELLVSIVVVTGLFALTFKVLPSAHIAWGDVWLGSLVTAVLFSIGKFLIGLYLGKSAVASSYGAGGTLVVVILWVYYSAQIFFYGAEFTHEHALLAGSRSGGREAANSEFAREDDAMVARARRIVKGKDPVIARPDPAR